MVRPGVWQTLRSVSNNVNKRASILRFYRPALSIFDNAPARARLAAKLPVAAACRGGWCARQDQKRIHMEGDVALGSFGKNRGRVTFVADASTILRRWFRGWAGGVKRIAKK